MKKIKVIEFIPTVGDGGAETLVKDYGLLMDRERFEVTVVVLHDMDTSANWKRLQDGNVPVIALSSRNDPLKKLWHRLFWRNKESRSRPEPAEEKLAVPSDTCEETGFFRLCRNWVRHFYFGLKFLGVLRRTGATVVHAHLDVLRCLQTISPFLKGVRLLHTCHNLPEMIYEGEELAAANWLISHNDLQLIALHDDMARKMDEMFPGRKTAVIRNGINMKLFREPGVTKEEKRRELEIPAEAFLVGHVGRFAPQKNHGFLVEIFREIANRQENARLLMVGAGDHSHIVEKLDGYGLQGRYQILSHRKDINELLAAMDVFVFPSAFEGLGIVLIEAQAAGLRCIASDQCPQEAFRRESCLRLPLEAPEEWAEAALDPDCSQPWDKSLEDYDMNREIRRLEALYLGQLK